MSELPFLPPYLLLVQETQERLRCSLVPNSLAVRTARCTYSSDLEMLHAQKRDWFLETKVSSVRLFFVFFLYPYLFVHLFCTFILLLTVLILSLGAKVS